MLETNTISVSPQVNEIKDLDDKGSYGGFLVLYGSPESTDLEQDFFGSYNGKETNFWLEDGKGKTPVLYGHGGDEVFGTKRLDKGFGRLVKKDAGVWMETQLQKRNKYEEYVHKLAKEGKLGLSSGTATHLVEKSEVETGDKSNKTANFISQWPLGLDGTLTPTPAEPRIGIQQLKDIESPSLKSIAQDILDGKGNSELKAMSVMDRLSVVRKDFREKFDSDTREFRISMNDIFDNFIVVHNRDTRKLFKVEYDGSVESGHSFQPRSEWTEVTEDRRFVARSVSKQLDDAMSLIKHRNGADTSEKDVGSLFDEMNQMLKEDA